MSTQQCAFRAFEEAGCLAALMGVNKEANPYVQAAKGESVHLLDQASRQSLADAWSKGWERCKNDPSSRSTKVVT